LNCRNLTQVKLLITLQKIGMEAFSNSGLRTLSIPASVKRIEEDAFRDCTGLESVVIGNGIDAFYVFLCRTTCSTHPDPLRG